MAKASYLRFPLPIPRRGDLIFDFRRRRHRKPTFGSGKKGYVRDLIFDFRERRQSKGHRSKSYKVGFLCLRLRRSLRTPSPLAITPFYLRFPVPKAKEIEDKITPSYLRFPVPKAKEIEDKITPSPSAITPCTEGA